MVDLDCIKEEAQVYVESLPKLTSRVGVLSWNNTGNDILVNTAEVHESWGIGHLNEVVLAMINTGDEGVRIEKSLNEGIDNWEADRRGLTMEVVGQGLQIEEMTSSVNVELAVVQTSIDEEDEWEDSLGVCREDTRGGEDELRVGLDRVLKTLVAKLCSSFEVICAVETELGRDGNELRAKG